jgi:hypothetical protein
MLMMTPERRPGSQKLSREQLDHQGGFHNRELQCRVNNMQCRLTHRDVAGAVKRWQEIAGCARAHLWQR